MSEQFTRTEAFFQKKGDAVYFALELIWLVSFALLLLIGIGGWMAGNTSRPANTIALASGADIHRGKSPFPEGRAAVTTPPPSRPANAADAALPSDSKDADDDSENEADAD